MKYFIEHTRVILQVFDSHNKKKHRTFSFSVEKISFQYKRQRFIIVNWFVYFAIKKLIKIFFCRQAFTEQHFKYGSVEKSIGKNNFTTMNGDLENEKNLLKREKAI